VLDYEEMPSDLAGISLFFSFRTPAYMVRVPIIPDNCIDLMFCRKGGHVLAYYCGTVLKLDMYPLVPDTEYFCVRFRTNLLGHVADIRARDCVNMEIIRGDQGSSEALVGRRLFAATTLADRAQVFGEGFGGYYRMDSDCAVVNRIVDEIHTAKGDIAISDIAHRFHYSYSHVYSQFVKYVGMTPKLYCRITRFQHIVRMLLAETHRSGADTGFASLCAVPTPGCAVLGTAHRRPQVPSGEELGFYDQSHFYKEIKKFSGATPMELASGRHPLHFRANT
jgi:AraC-like DNA-binding protein